MNKEKFFFQPQIILQDNQRLIYALNNNFINLSKTILQIQQKANPNLRYIIQNNWLSSYEPRKNKPWQYENQIEQNFGSQTINKVFVQCIFLNLQDLYLTSMNIDNLEFIAFINAPRLNSFIVNSNKITNLKPLNKKKFSIWGNINFEDNPAPHVSLQRYYIKSDSSSVNLQMEPYQNVIMQDLSGLIKLQLSAICYLQIYGQKRIKQDKLLSKLRQRFSVWEQNKLIQQIQIVRKGKYQ